MTRNDVVVTGLGATTPLGGDVETTWQNLLSGHSGVQMLDPEIAEGLTVQIAAPVRVDPKDVLKPVQARRLDRFAQLALVAAREAWEDAGTPELDPTRLGVAIGSGIGGAQTLLYQDNLRQEKGAKRVSPLTVPMLMPNAASATVGLEVGAQGGVHTTVSACASGSEAIALALDLLRAGRVDVIVAGGAEGVIHPLPLAGFAQMRALSTRNDEPARASRPFDVERDGFVMGEGAGVLVLEREEFARARGARIYAHFSGAGVTSDAHDMVQPEPEGAGAARSITLALQNAQLSPKDIDHINAHATSTPLGDVAEAAAIRSAIGDHPVVSAPKGSFGHLLGAAGAVEAMCAVLSLRDQVAPPTLNLEKLDDAVQLDVAADARRTPIRAAVSNSFGFGGHNTTLAFTHVE